MNAPTVTPIRVAVLGAGSWGIALANHCAHLGHTTSLWEFDTQAAETLKKTRRRDVVLRDVLIHERIDITDDLEHAVRNVQMILLVTPSHVVRGVLGKLRRLIPDEAILVNCAKGLEVESLSRISEIVAQELPFECRKRYAVLSGPSHAEEVSRNIPTAIVAAAEDDAVAKFVQGTLSSLWLRVYRSSDVIGVELGGALKNIIAIAAGVCDGAGFGDNTKAALQPRGLAEIARLGQKLGADPLTFAGLSGMGDLIVTCMSRHSRNRYVGEEIGKGIKLSDILKGMAMVAEGVRTAQAAVALAEKHQTEMPICREVYKLLYENKDPRQALIDLLTREVKPEFYR